MDSLKNVYIKIKPVFYTFIFEIRLHIKKFVGFSVATILVSTLFNYLNYFNRFLPSSQAYFYEFGTSYFMMIIVLAISFFFGGIICSEFKNKTGLAVLPLTNRYKLLIGKYLANLILVIGITVIHYLTLALFGYNYYGGPLLKTMVYSFGFAVLYILALGSFVTFLSSILPSITPIIIIVVGYILIIDSVITTFLLSFISEIEPLYSFSYLSNIVRYIFFPEFSTMERRKPYNGRWLFPSIEGALVLLSLFVIIFLIFSAFLFKRREF